MHIFDTLNSTVVDNMVIPLLPWLITVGMATNAENNAVILH